MFVIGGKAAVDGWAMDYLCRNPKPGRWIYIADACGPGFSYLLAVVDRQGIAEVNGRSLK